MNNGSSSQDSMTAPVDCIFSVTAGSPAFTLFSLKQNINELTVLSTGETTTNGLIFFIREKDM